MKSFRFLSFLGLLIVVQVAYGSEKVEEKPLEEPNLSKESEAKSTKTAGASDEGKSEAPTTSADENTTGNDKEYALGSLCNYCSYCKVGSFIGSVTSHLRLT